MSFVLLGILNSQAAGGDAVAPAFDLLATQITSSTTSSITFSGLDAYSDYKHLQFRIEIQRSAAASDLRNMTLRINNDTSSSYDAVGWGGNPSILTSSFTNADAFYFSNGVPSYLNGVVGLVRLDILDFSNASKRTSFRELHASYDSGEKQQSMSGGFYDSTNAVTSVTFAIDGQSINSNSRFSIYGIKG